MTSLDDKENVPSTPVKQHLHSLVENSPSSPKKALKPVSPNKYSHLTVGRLSFLQNDSIDSHFDYIHASHEQIQQLMQLIEAQTKQTNLELGQLFDRLKNNNQNLNKLLESISNYSKEVTTEGTATKTDVGNIMNVLRDLKVAGEDGILKSIEGLQEHKRSLENISHLVQKLHDLSSQNKSDLSGQFDELRNELEKLVSQASNSKGQDISKSESSRLQLEILSSLNMMRQELDDSREVSNRSIRTKLAAQDEILNTILSTLTQKLETGYAEILRVILDSFGETMDKQSNDILLQISQAFSRVQEELSNEITAHLSQGIDSLTQTIKTNNKLSLERQEESHRLMELKIENLAKDLTVVIRSNSETSSSEIKKLAQFERLAELQTAAIEQLTVRVGKRDEQLLLQKSASELQQSHDSLSSKYEKLKGCYLEKLSKFVELQHKFEELTLRTVELEDRVASAEPNRYDKLQLLHTKNVSRLSKENAVPLKKRVFSLPAAVMENGTQMPDDSEPEF